MFPLLPKGDQTKLLKFFRLQIFSICHWCRWHRWQTLSCEYLREFSKKFETVLKEYSGAGGNWFMKRTRSKKSRDTVPLRLLTMFPKLNLPLLNQNRDDLIAWRMDWRRSPEAKSHNFTVQSFKSASSASCSVVFCCHYFKKRIEYWTVDTRVNSHCAGLPCCPRWPLCRWFQCSLSSPRGPPGRNVVSAFLK